MTVDLNKYYGVTIFHGEKIGPRKYQAKAEIFRRDNCKVLETFYTDGGTMSSADTRALSEAKQRVVFLSIPQDWNKTI